MAFYAKSNTSLAHHVILQECPPLGTRIFVFEKEGSNFPEKDYLQDSLVIAKECCLDDYGIAFDSWKEIPDNHEDLYEYPSLPWE